MSDFERELKEAFLDEAAQLVADAEQCFLNLESNPHDASIIDQLFRLAHNLKGSGNAVGFMELGAFTHKLESLLLKIKNKELQTTKSVADLLLKCNDHLQTWIRKLREDQAATMDSVDLLNNIEQQLSGNVTPQETTDTAVDIPYPSADSFPEATDEQAHVEAAKAIEHVISEAPKNIHHHVEAKKATPPAKPADESIRVSLNRLEKLINFVGEMVILQTVLQEQSNNSNPFMLRKTVHQLGKVTKEVQDISMSLRMIPLKQIFQKMQRIVRDTSGSLNKKVTLHLSGEDTEVDKTVLESLGDPLVHLIRNAVDHGIESAETRLANNKPEEGQVYLSAFHQSSNLVIDIRDDGAGLDPQKLKSKAIEKGLIRPDATLSDKDAYLLIFAAGFSTKTEVTDVSGRGVGMDVVKTNIEALQGSIQVETVLGKGTQFRITLPLTLAIIDGMIVKTAGERFVIPLSHVHETIKPTSKDLTFVTGIGNVFSLRGESLPLHALDNLLDRKPTSPGSDHGTAIVVRGQKRSFAVMVDEIVGQAQVVIKQLGQDCQHLKGFSGSAILGDGRPALILELEELSLRSKTKSTPVPVTQLRRA